MYNEEEGCSDKEQSIFIRTTGQTIDIYISGEIKAPECYIEKLEVINTASDQDVIYLRINSYGGYLSTALQLRKALLNTRATIVACIEGECFSAATMLFLCGDIFEVLPEAVFMIHDYSGVMAGKGNEMHRQSKFMATWSKEFYNNVYGNFLDEEEISNLINGIDIWLSAQDLKIRLEKFSESRLKDNKEEEEL